MHRLYFFGILEWSDPEFETELFFTKDDGTKIMLQEAAEKGWLPYNRVRQKEVFM